MKPSTAILLAIVAVGFYLLWRSIQNIGYAVNGAVAGPKAVWDGATATLGAEGTAIWNTLAMPAKLFSGVGTWFDSPTPIDNVSTDFTYDGQDIFSDDFLNSLTDTGSSDLIHAGDLFNMDTPVPGGGFLHFGDTPGVQSPDWSIGQSNGDSSLPEFDIFQSPGSW